MHSFLVYVRSMFSFVTNQLGSNPQTYFQVVPGISKIWDGFYYPCMNGNGAMTWGIGAMSYTDCQPVANQWGPTWRATGGCILIQIA